MASGTVSVHIERPPDEVFAFVADAENNPRWHSYVVETRWLDDGPMRVGRRGRQVSRILGLRYEVEAAIEAWDPPTRVVWQSVAGGAEVRTDCRVGPEGVGARMMMIVEGEFTKGPLRLLGPVAIAVFKRQALGDLRRLVSVLEAGTESEL